MSSLESSTVRDADVAGARRLMGAMRRIDRVVVDVDARGTRCMVHGISHRLPSRRRVPLALARGLQQLGVTLTVRGTR